MRTYQNTPLDRITRERDVAFDVARNVIHTVRYSDTPCPPALLRDAVRMARGLQWNAAHIYRMRIATERAA